MALIKVLIVLILAFVLFIIGTILFIIISNIGITVIEIDYGIEIYDLMQNGE